MLSSKMLLTHLYNVTSNMTFITFNMTLPFITIKTVKQVIKIKAGISMNNEKMFETNVVLNKNSNNKKKKLVKKIFKYTTIVFLLLIFIGFSILPNMIYGDSLNKHVNFKETYNPSDYGLKSEKLVLKTEDNLNLAAYEVKSEKPKAVVIFISGIHNPSVTAFYGHAKMLKQNGFASILMEMRAHGESEGNLICLGYKEVLDVKAVVNYIKKNNDYKNVPIVVYGVSMGGATAINSIGEIKEIDGLISMSAFSSCEDVTYDNMVNMKMPRLIAYIEKPFIKVYTTIKYGINTYNIIPKKEIKKLGNRPALIMHSSQDSQVPYESFKRITKNAPNHVETLTREGDFHFMVKPNNDTFLKPEQDIEYKDTILNFLNKNFTKR